MKANANIGTISNVIYEKTGRMFNRGDVAYLGGICNELKEIDGLEKSSTIDKTITYLKKIVMTT